MLEDLLDHFLLVTVDETDDLHLPTAFRADERVGLIHLLDQRRPTLARRFASGAQHRLRDLREPHGPLPRNPLIAEPLFRAGYAEKAGSSTTDMIDACRAAGVPEPEFRQHGPHFVVTLWRDWLTDEVLAGLGLNERQMLAIAHLKRHARITNTEYQRLAKTTRKTAARDLEGLVAKGVFLLVGEKRGSHYVRRGKK